MKNIVASLLVLLIAIPIGNIAGDLFADVVSPPTSHRKIASSSPNKPARSHDTLGVKHFTCDNFLKDLSNASGQNASEEDRIGLVTKLMALYIEIYHGGNHSITPPSLEKLQKFSETVGQMCSREEWKNQTIFSLFSPPEIK